MCRFEAPIACSLSFLAGVFGDERSTDRRKLRSVSDEIELLVRIGFHLIELFVAGVFPANELVVFPNNGLGRLSSDDPGHEYGS